jgi:hypothetical protein
MGFPEQLFRIIAHAGGGARLAQRHVLRSVSLRAGRRAWAGEVAEGSWSSSFATCAILRAMESETAFTERLAQRLRRTGLGGIACTLLEAVGPLAILGAQACYLAEPFLGGAEGNLGQMGRLLDDPDRTAALIDALRISEEK